MSQISQTTTTTPPAAEAASPLLHSKLAAVRRKMATVSAASGLAFAVAAVALLIASEMILDWWLELPRVARAAFLAVELALVAFALFRYVLYPLFFGPDDETIALRVEAAEPTFRHRLIAAVQLARPEAVPAGTSRSLVRATIRQAEELSQKIDFGKIVSAKRLVRLAVLAFIILALGVAGFVYANEDHTSTDLLRRAFLSEVPVPRKTRIRVLSRALTLFARDDAPAGQAALDASARQQSLADGDVRVPKGENLVIGAAAAGVVPDAGRIEVTYEAEAGHEGHQEQFDLLPLSPSEKTAAYVKDVKDVFGRPLENVQRSFAYRILLGDNATPYYRVTVMEPPAVKSLEVTQVFPAYTRMGAVPRSLGDLSVLGGSSLRLKVAANHAVSLAHGPNGTGNVVRLLGRENTPGPATTAPATRASTTGPATNPAAAALADRSVPLKRVLREVELSVDPQNPSELSAPSVPLAPDVAGFSIQLRDDNGLTNKDPVVYRINLVADKEPTVRITYPDRKEELVTRMARLRVDFDATDDFGLGKLSLRYKIDDGPEQSEPIKLPSTIPANGLRTFRASHTWLLSTVKVEATSEKPSLEGRTIEYWVEAEDENTITGPGRGQSEHFIAKVVTDAEKRAEMLARLSQSIEGLKGTSEDQEKLNENLGGIIVAPPTTQPGK